MTKQKHLKQLVRARMKKTGERYAAARRQILSEFASPAVRDATRWHYPGSIPIPTALRAVCAAAGIRNPHTGEPFSEAMIAGIAGGIGLILMAFRYEKEDFSSFFIGGRHLFQDDKAYAVAACERLGVKPVLRETTGGKAAEKQLREALAGERPALAWVDMAHLPHRAMPPQWSGGGYHVVTVYGIDDQTGEVVIGDMSDRPIRVKQEAFAESRSRIRKQKHRLLTIPETSPPRELRPLVYGGLQACHAALGSGKQRSFTLKAIATWAERMHGKETKESWSVVFPPGRHLWMGLTCVYDFIEHYGTGGGLMRPLFGSFLAEAGDALSAEPLRALAERYFELGRQWSELADAALPDGVPMFREAKELYVAKAELTAAGEPNGPEEIRAIWKRLYELTSRAGSEFPLSETECDALRASLKTRIRAIYEGEVAAHEALGEALA